MDTEQVIRYLSVAGSLCSIIALLITVTVKLNMVSIISIIVAVVGSIILFAFLIWLIKKGANKFDALFDSKSALWLYYFMGILISIVLVCSVFIFLYGLISLLLTGFVTIMKDGLASIV